MKRNRFYRVEDMVREMLEQYPHAREDDDYLYLLCVKRYNTSVGSMDVNSFFTNRALMQIPTYETITRVKRKVLAQREDLQPAKEVIDERYNTWKEAREYAQV